MKWWRIMMLFVIIICLIQQGLKESFGGTGQQFDWGILKKAKIEKPFFLSGGIGPDDAGESKSI
jgi:phosphoribosylanthranilate isomerase